MFFSCVLSIFSIVMLVYQLVAPSMAWTQVRVPDLTGAPLESAAFAERARNYVVKAEVGRDFFWLVVWLPSIWHFPRNIGNFIIPIDFLRFFRGVAQPPTSVFLKMRLIHGSSDSYRTCPENGSCVFFLSPPTIVPR